MENRLYYTRGWFSCNEISWDFPKNRTDTRANLFRVSLKYPDAVTYRTCPRRDPPCYTRRSRNFLVITRSRDNFPRIVPEYACTDRRDLTRKWVEGRARRWKLQRIKTKDARECDDSYAAARERTCAAKRMKSFLAAARPDLINSFISRQNRFQTISVLCTSSHQFSH